MRVKFSHVNCHFSFIFNAPDLFTSFHVSAICNKVIQFQNCWEKTSPCFALATLTLSRISHKQEPITRSLQLPHIPVTAFPQTDLFLVWIYLAHRSPQEPQWPIPVTKLKMVKDGKAQNGLQIKKQQRTWKIKAEESWESGQRRVVGLWNWIASFIRCIIRLFCQLLLLKVCWKIYKRLERKYFSLPHIFV